MIKYVEQELLKIQAQMQNLELDHLYWLREDWKILNAKREVLGEILKRFKN